MQHQDLTIAEKQLLRIGYIVGLVGMAQYVIVTFWLMTQYPGGRIGFKESVGYDFMMNFLSDLGRTSRFGRGPNPTAFGYMATLATAGVATIIFFGSLSYYFFRKLKASSAIAVLILGIIAGIGYIGVALNPINEGYWTHVKFVQWGFIGFWLMTVTVAYCIFKTQGFPNAYGRILVIFAIILGLQIIVMLFGPRSWSSDSALLLQVTAQKIVVYSEVAAMGLLAWGSIRALDSPRVFEKTW